MVTHGHGILRSLGGEREGRGDGQTIGGDRMVAAMAMTTARLPLFFHIAYFPAARHFAVPADDAAAGEGGEAEKPNETHDVLRCEVQQFACRLSCRPVVPIPIHVGAKCTDVQLSRYETHHRVGRGFRSLDKGLCASPHGAEPFEVRPALARRDSTREGDAPQEQHMRGPDHRELDLHGVRADDWQEVQKRGETEKRGKERIAAGVRPRVPIVARSALYSSCSRGVTSGGIMAQGW